MLVHAVLEVYVAPGERPEEAAQPALQALTHSAIGGKSIRDWALNEMEGIGIIPHFGHHPNCDCRARHTTEQSEGRIARILGLAIEFDEFDEANLGRYRIDEHSQLWLYEFMLPLTRDFVALEPIALVDPEGHDWRNLPTLRRLRISAGLPSLRLPWDESRAETRPRAAQSPAPREH